MSNHPTSPRPSELAAVAPRELGEAWLSHLAAVERGRAGQGRRTPEARVATAALDALAVAEALVLLLTGARWATAHAALAYGATVDQVAAAMGLTVDEVSAALLRWMATDEAERGGFALDEAGELVRIVRGYGHQE